MTRSLRFAVALSALSICAFLGCTQGEELEAAPYSWGVPVQVDAEGLVQEPTDLAVNGSGAAVVGWTDQKNQVWTNRYQPDQGWSTAELMETGPGYVSYSVSPRVAISQDGSALLVWVEDQPSAIRASHYAPGEGWSGPEQLDRSSDQYLVSGVDVAMDQGGRAIATWRRQGNEPSIVASRYEPGRGWLEPERIDDSNAADGYDTRVAVNPGGDAIAIWLGGDGSGGRVFANQYTPASGWQASEAIDSGDSWIEGPEVAIDGSGNGIAVWRQDYYDGAFSSTRITANRYTPNDGWRDPEPIEADSQSYSYLPHIAMNVSGVAMVVWTRSEQGETPGGVLSMRYDRESGWENEELIEPNPFASSDRFPRVAIDPKGNALMVCKAYGRATEAVLSSHYEPGEGWDDSMRIDIRFLPPGPPQVGMDDRGKGIAVWTKSTAHTSGVFANHYDESPAEDHGAFFQPICDARCTRATECELLDGEEDVAQCLSECMADFNRLVCDPNQGGAEICIRDIGAMSCGDLEVGNFPYECEYVCVGDTLCDDRTCDDQNECTDDACDPADGSCVSSPAADGTPCADGAGTCDGGFCGSVR